jgi:hypothetical protein
MITGESETGHTPLGEYNPAGTRVSLAGSWFTRKQLGAAI